MDNTPRGTKEGEPYLSYLLRLWRVSDEEEPVWRASLKSAHSGERLGFASLEELFDYLRTETGVKPALDFGNRASARPRFPKSEKGGADSNSADPDLPDL
jgi:hypothetical protein